MSPLAASLHEIRAAIEAAARRSERDPSEVRILAVSKTFPAHRVEEAARLGQTMFGENRVQEAQGKIPEVHASGLEWHLIGHLQSNKVRQAVTLFDVIQSIDSRKLARRLELACVETGKRMPVLIQANIGEEAQKSGVDLGGLDELAEYVASLEHLQLRGLMAIPPFFEDPERSRPYFRRLEELRRKIEDRHAISLPELSMGMSSDYVIAVEEGATIVRVGTALFGKRG